MRLRKKKTYRSINSIPSDVELPPFTLLVGLNGSGKTQLLEAIDSTAIECLDENENVIERNKIRFFDCKNFLPSNEADVRSEELGQSRNNVWNIVRKGQESIQIQLLEATYHNDHASSLMDNPELLWQCELEDIQAEIDDKEIAASVHQWLQNKLNELTIEQLKRLERNHPKILKLVNEITEDKCIPFLSLTKQIFLERLPIGAKRTDPFTAALTDAFAEYRAAQRDNKENRIRARQDQSVRHLDEQEFVEKFGRPPWEIINEILESSNLDFRISEPAAGVRNQAIKLELQHDSSMAPLKIQDLSSGEQILLGIARCLFYMGSTNVRLLPPKVLLLDEIDSPLHPTMTQQLINVLTTVVAKRHRIYVILATHSPTTVALSPEKSLFNMQAKKPRIVKTTKDAALTFLTSGLPTLSIKHENRRQVFVESENDEKIFEPVFRKLRSYCNPEISLHFIASGKGGAGNCDQVKDLVNSLQLAGNSSVRGIIDWDAKNNGNDNIIAFGRDKRYSIENYMLDPLLVAVFLFREKRISRTDVQLDETQTHVDFLKLPQDKLQAVADWFVTTVGEKHPDEAKDMSAIECSYVNGKRIDLPKWYLLMRGHDLEELLKRAFKHLREFRGERKLIFEIVRKVVDDLPGLLPEDFLTLFKRLQS